MMKWQTQLIIILTAVTVVSVVIYLIRKKSLKEEYSLLWLLGSIVIIAAAILSRNIINAFEFINPDSAGEILLFFIILGLLAFILLFSVKLSTIKDQNKNLAQSIALLEEELKSFSSKDRRQKHDRKTRRNELKINKPK